MHFYSLYLVASFFLFARIKQLLLIIMVMVGLVNSFTLDIYFCETEFIKS